MCPSGSKIQSFYQGKAVLLTGGGGFLGKLILEKLVRSCKIHKVFILLRRKNNFNGQKRLETILKSKVFDLIKTSSPELLAKIIVVEGDVTKPDLGMKNDEHALIIKDVSIVIHAAATVSFNQPLAQAIQTNVEGTKNIMEFCKGIGNLKAVVYVSTAYSNCDLEGKIEEKIYPANLKPDVAIFLGNHLCEDQMVQLSPALVGRKPNTYTYTKHLAENLVNSYKELLPVCIVRPSIIMSTEEEPFPGWIGGVNALTGCMIGIYTGLIRTAYFSTKHPDLIPADHVVNAILAAAWRTSQSLSGKKELAIYNIVSGQENPILSEKLLQHSDEASNKTPSGSSIWIISFKGTFTNSRIKFGLINFVFHKLPCYILQMLSLENTKFVKVHSKFEEMWPMSSLFFTKTFDFAVKEKNELLASLTETDLQLFGFDIKTVSWATYFKNYIHGIRKYILKEEDSTILASIKKQRRLKMFQGTISFFVFLALVMGFIYLLSSQEKIHLAE